MSTRLKFVIPATFFTVVLLLLGIGLRMQPEIISSPLIDKPAPTFSLPTLSDAQNFVDRSQFDNTIWVLNVWASWCGTCIAEHPVITKLAKNSNVRVIGLNYKDERTEAIKWLRRYGNPYALSLVDKDGRTGIDWGVYKVPETFVVDKKGIIRYKHIGAIDERVLSEVIKPLIAELADQS